MKSFFSKIKDAVKVEPKPTKSNNHTRAQSAQIPSGSGGYGTFGASIEEEYKKSFERRAGSFDEATKALAGGYEEKDDGVFFVDEFVKISGLIGLQKKHNGQIGKIIKRKLLSNSYDIKLDGKADPITLKGVMLSRIKPNDSAYPADVAESFDNQIPAQNRILDEQAELL